MLGFCRIVSKRKISEPKAGGSVQKILQGNVGRIEQKIEIRGGGCERQPRRAFKHWLELLQQK